MAPPPPALLPPPAVVLGGGGALPLSASLAPGMGRPWADAGLTARRGVLVLMPSIAVAGLDAAAEGAEGAQHI